MILKPLRFKHLTLIKCRPEGQPKSGQTPLGLDVALEHEVQVHGRRCGRVFQKQP